VAAPICPRSIRFALWAIVTELQTTLKAFDRIEHASKAKAEPLDLPTLPRSRGLN
jgi:hypothetical protein